jgi:cytochrome c biogenesis protein CcmG, thiol:disulfide interchange protein DsbE
MSARASIAAGLAAGIAAAILLLVLVVAFVPDPVIGGPTPLPTTGSGTASPVPTQPGGSSPIGPSAISPGPSGAANFRIGEPAPALAVPILGGGTIDLADLRGKPVWVNFMATWCPPCRDEFPAMSGFAARYAENGLVVIAVDVREDEATVGAFVESVATTFDVGLDADGSAQQEWGAFVLPIHFWIDTEGVIRHGALGGIGPDLMAEGLQTILPGVVVEP